MSWKAALQPYIDHPERFLPSPKNNAQSVVVYFNNEVVIVTDGFPKATEHLLVLPRSNALTRMHPTTALTEQVKKRYQQYIDIAVEHVTKEFMKKYKVRDEGSPEHFAKTFVQVGIHTVPSMNNLHIHVITKDFNSPRLKNKKHYNSFNTDFFVPWDRLPLEHAPIDSKSIEKKYLKDSDLICCYCDRNFTNKCANLKRHLAEEFALHFTAV